MEKAFPVADGTSSLDLPLSSAPESDPSTAPWKYKMIALVCALLMSAGSHFSTNALNALKSTIKADMGIDNTQYGVISSSVSLINTILPFLGGVWMDRFGTGWGALLSTGLIVIGNAFSAMAAHLDSYAWMVVSRVIFGLGSGCVVVAQETILSKWFRGKGLAITIGLQITVSRLFNFLAHGTAIPIKNNTGFYGNPFWVACGISAASWLFTIIYLILLKYTGGWEMGKKSHFSLDKVTRIPLAFWILPLNIFFLGGVWTPFLGIATEFVQQRFGTSELISAWTSSVSLAVPVAISPFAGLFYEKYGKRGPVVILSAVLLVIAMALLGWSDASPMAGLVLFSLSLTLAPVALTSSVALIVPPGLIGTGIGIHKGCLNAGVSLVDVMVGAIQDHQGGSYARVSTAMLVLSCITVILACFFWYVDVRFLSGILDAPFSIRKGLQEDRQDAYLAGSLIPLTPRARMLSWIAMAIVVAVLILSWVVYGVYLFK
ncbi:major facilitator superfamily domain-containing protein [Piptocephalis cylindrospora]|uniref:Lysosomal dipeptide transporter MFSD1 n=1 Tax=Piptocephalis cylindrospora TaxID=1907219 RepID=A0A4P9Y234_9FUNG|nr:major facilitator superfamily domain-containing protein [Piptocephalis cylindrospora]|eukprot:RKP12918.1 major facilitator superfamily domain-containing protein [Piptocephalis cylindrospora]